MVDFWEAKNTIFIRHIEQNNNKPHQAPATPTQQPTVNVSPMFDISMEHWCYYFPHTNIFMGWISCLFFALVSAQTWLIVVGKWFKQMVDCWEYKLHSNWSYHLLGMTVQQSVSILFLELQYFIFVEWSSNQVDCWGFNLPFPFLLVYLMTTLGDLSSIFHLTLVFTNAVMLI